MNECDAIVKFTGFNSSLHTIGNFIFDAFLHGFDLIGVHSTINSYGNMRKTSFTELRNKNNKNLSVFPAHTVSMTECVFSALLKKSKFMLILLCSA